MKKFMAFVLCVAFCLGIIGSNSATRYQEGLILSEFQGPILRSREFRVFQVQSDNNSALLKIISKNNEIWFDDSDIVLLLYNDSAELHYNGEIIKIPEEKCARQVGVFQYRNKLNKLITVRAIRIEPMPTKNTLNKGS